jgi:excisionase family DNA binding protein
VKAEGLVSVREAADYLGVAERTVYALVQSGNLRRYMIGTGRRNYRLNAQDVRQYAEGCVQPVAVIQIQAVRKYGTNRKGA